MVEKVEKRINNILIRNVEIGIKNGERDLEVVKDSISREIRTYKRLRKELKFRKESFKCLKEKFEGKELEEFNDGLIGF